MAIGFVYSHAINRLLPGMSNPKNYFFAAPLASGRM